MVSRLAEHKGFDLVRYILKEMLERDIQFVLLGTGDGDLEGFFSQIAKEYPQKTGISLFFDKDLSRQIYAGADIFLMPSRTEPCGLSQMIACRYGTVPVVRETGGLYDTVAPYTEHVSKAGRLTVKGNGFTFSDYNAHCMLDALDRAVSVYRQPEKWQRLVKRAMKTDFSWNVSASEYVKLYIKLL
jgi:starch synthase